MHHRPERDRAHHIRASGGLNFRPWPVASRRYPARRNPVATTTRPYPTKRVRERCVSAIVVARRRAPGRGPLRQDDHAAKTGRRSNARPNPQGAGHNRQSPFNKSVIRTWNVSASVLSVCSVTFVSPRSISPICARCRPERSDRTSLRLPQPGDVRTYVVLGADFAHALRGQYLENASDRNSF